MSLSRRVRFGLIAAATVVVLLVVALVVVLTLPRPLASVDVATTTADLTNPERGWTDAVDLTQPDSITSAQRDGVTIVHTYVRLDAYRDSAIPADFLATLDRGFSALRSAHMKVVLRFAYNFDGAGPDAPLARIEEHVAQVKPVLAENQDVVLAFEAGFIGAWGEWHDSTNGLATAAGKAAVLKAVLKAFPSSRDVALRYPYDIRALVPKQVTAGTAYGGSAAARIGNHQDCFLSSDPDDRGTWGQNGGTVEGDKALVASLGRYTIVGGEICGTSPRTTCPTALSELNRLHFTYLNRQFDASALALLQQGGCSREIGQRLGYRLAVTRVEWTQEADHEGTFRLELTVRNTGFAHVVNARPVYAVLSRGGTSVPVRLRTDVRTWAAGATTTVSEDVRLPASVAPGRWALSLWAPDAAADLRDIPEYAIRFAQADGWDARTGRNALPATVTVD
ncbi:DUF4832 domain-containing protein [Amnibacterium setariae]|uniref:DUF4832 domain-containing protein n=1 Tax=Amnibacterium setariae TaxID=2306585 RepID=A0A3A1U1H6_9MICO|nr:DUF4832 domain-containing protein [Amnibacterium setariae]RIX28795.1 DUF4832 domain-containing protein [Amnibacterium setariae]